MNENLIEKHTKLLNSFERVILNTKDEELRETSKQSYIIFIKDLANLEKKEVSIYEEKLKVLNIEPKLIEQTINEINLKRTTSVAEESKENEQKITQETEENVNTQEEISKPKEEKVEEPKDETLEEYILTTVYRHNNQSIGAEHQKLELKLEEDLKNSNDKLIKTWISNYIAFTEKYKNELDKDKLIKYMSELFKKYDVEKKYIDKLPEIITEINKNNLNKAETKEQIPIENAEEKKQDSVKEEKPLEILNIKKSFKSNKELTVLGTTALIGIGGAVLGAPGLLTLPIAAIIWKLYKNKGITNNKLKSYLIKHGYSIDEETKELKDSNGEVITAEKIGKSKYEMLKQYLLKLSNSKKNGEIKNEYKKNKTTSKLLSSSIVDKLKIFKKKNINEENNLEENQEIHKGMGKC